MVDEVSVNFNATPHPSPSVPPSPSGEGFFIVVEYNKVPGHPPAILIAKGGSGSYHSLFAFSTKGQVRMLERKEGAAQRTAFLITV